GARVQPGAQTLDVEPVFVTSPAELERALPDLLSAPALGFDTEGTGLDPLTARLRLAQFTTGRRVYLVDLFRLPAAALQPIVEAAGLLIGHNLKFDLRMLTVAGIALPAAVGGRLFDTMLAS